MSEIEGAITGEAAGVPYVALPPADGPEKSAPLVVGWHLNDPPRSAAAMAAALPLNDLEAWRIYVDLPMHGKRQLPGGLSEFMQRGYQDAVLEAFEPQVTQAVEEFPAVLTAIRGRFPIDDGPIGLIGASIGALPAQLVVADHITEVSAAVLISPVIQLAEVIAANERRFAVTYPWSDASRAVAERYDLVARAGEIAAADPQPAVLLVVGEDDDFAFERQSRRLRSALAERYADRDRLDIVTIPAMGHAFATEPGIEPEPQSEEAQRIDDTATGWLSKHLHPARP